MASKETKLKILIVEDSADQIEIFNQRLTIAGVSHEIHPCDTGEAALEYIKESNAGLKELPELIILDLKLPGINGLEVLKNFQKDERWKTIPVVVLSVSEDLQDVVKTYKLGGTFYMKKPFDRKVFEEIISQLKVTGRIKAPLK